MLSTYLDKFLTELGGHCYQESSKAHSLLAGGINILVKLYQEPSLDFGYIEAYSVVIVRIGLSDLFGLLYGETLMEVRII